MVSDNFLLRSELYLLGHTFLSCPRLHAVAGIWKAVFCWSNPIISHFWVELQWPSSLGAWENGKGTFRKLTQFDSHNFTLGKKGPETQRIELKPDHGTKAMTDFRSGREKLILGAAVTDGMSNIIVSLSCLSLSVCLSLCFCTCSVALISLPHSLPTLAAMTHDIHYTFSRCFFVMHGQLFLFATPNTEMPCKTQPSVVELSCKLIFFHRKTLPFVSHILIRMAFHYPDGIITSALTQCCFRSPFPTCSYFSTCWLVTLLKECLPLLPLLTFTSGFSVQLPVSHKHLPGSGCFGATVRNNSLWLIQHCCLIDHSDQVLEADAPTGDLFTLRLGLELT